MRQQIQTDLTLGYASWLDQLTARAATDLFRQRIESSDQQFAWWDAETRGNWLWGYTLLAFLSDLPEHQAKVSALLQDLLASQDADGYLGIYSPSARYQHGDGENGELWAQSRALLALLTWYEFTGEPGILQAVQRAADLTLQHYGTHNPYFRKPNRQNLAHDGLTGMTHGLCYVDVVEWLFQLTGETRYRAFGQWLYQDFCQLAVPFPNDDLSATHLQSAHYPLQGHAVHTAEHLRAVLFAENATLITAALTKLHHYTTPSGALLGDESLHGFATPEIGYEYCTLTELLFSLNSAVQKLGDPHLADWAEILTFNAAQGARLPDGSALSYLTSDTRLSADHLRPDSYSHLHGKHGRFKYSPTHEDVACCCNPNALRLLPHYLSRAWLALADGSGWAAMLYAPCTLDTHLQGVSIRISQTADYPFSDGLHFRVQVSQAVRFSLWLRQPGWVKQMRVAGVTAKPVGEFWRVTADWQGETDFSLMLEPAVQVQAYPTGEVAVQRGALLYALSLAHTPQLQRRYPQAGFCDYDFTPQDLRTAYQPIVLSASQPDYGLRFEQLPPAEGLIWQNPPTRLWYNQTALVPFGSTLLRRAAFGLAD
jgi:DUF1680 family protein